MNKTLKFSKYNGNDDPIMHIHIFSNEASLITMDDYLHAKIFPLYLIYQALEWFNKLSHRSIKDFG